MSNEGPASDATRRVLGASTDPRVERTRSAITDAVRRLSSTGADLSVSAIVREAGVSRAGFYAHFAGLDELAGHLMRDAFESIADEYDLSREDPAVAMRVSQQHLVDHIVENRALYRAVAALPVSKDGYLSRVRTMAALVERAVAAHPEALVHGHAAATARYIASAAYGLIDAWLTGEIELEPEELVERLTVLLPRWFSGL